MGETKWDLDGDVVRDDPEEEDVLVPERGSEPSEAQIAVSAQQQTSKLQMLQLCCATFDPHDADAIENPDDWTDDDCCDRSTAIDAIASDLGMTHIQGMDCCERAALFMRLRELHEAGIT